jgi:photosystem II stability/assembly factor-like uncharacterized protein
MTPGKLEANRTGEEAVRALEQSVSDPKSGVAGTRTGVFRSADDGQNWQQITRVDDAELLNVDSLAIDPRDARTIYVGTYHLPWKTTDGGKTWNSISAGMIDDSDIMSLRLILRIRGAHLFQCVLRHLP